MKKVLLALLCLIPSSTAFASSSFMPDNDLYLQDRMDIEMPNAVSQTLFKEIIAAGKSAYDPLAKENKERLVINALWSNSTVNANCCRGCKTNEVTVNMYGGLARRSEVNAAGFALVLCHELSHAYGGEPYIQPSRKMSAEGQSDYGATKDCYIKIAEKVPALKEKSESYDKYSTEKCNDNVDCLNALAGGLSLGKLLAVLSNEPVPSYETPDKTVVTSTKVSYPDTVQCRTDSYHNGWFKLPRPACWYKEGDNGVSDDDSFDFPWPLD